MTYLNMEIMNWKKEALVVFREELDNAMKLKKEVSILYDIPRAGSYRLTGIPIQLDPCIVLDCISMDGDRSQETIYLKDVRRVSVFD